MLIYFDIFVKDFFGVFLFWVISLGHSKTAPKNRRARACPSPSFPRAFPSPCNDRGGQAPALRLSGRFYRRARARPPRF